MNVCEIFFSLQGESTFAGLPCIFIRLSGCNLRCSYCDTPYCYEEGKQYTIDQILAEIAQYKCSLVEITGGEPLQQKDTIKLMQSLKIAGYNILLETNGSVSLKGVPGYVHIIMDVKLPGSGESESFLFENIDYLEPGKDEIKFVITDKTDFETALSFVINHQLLEQTLLFSPVSEQLQPAQLAEWIQRSGLPLRLNLQLHKILNFK